MPTRMSISPASRPSAIRRRSAAPVRFVSSATAHRSLAEQAALGRDVQAVEQRPQREVVLLGEHLGRRHERPLVAALHRHEQRGERDHRLARTHLALEQPVHRRGRRHVAHDLGERALLVGRERERERRVERRTQLALDLVLDAAAIAFERALARDEPDLHAQELVEREARPASSASPIDAGRWMSV